MGNAPGVSLKISDLVDTNMSGNCTNLSFAVSLFQATKTATKCFKSSQNDGSDDVCWSFEAGLNGGPLLGIYFATSDPSTS